MLCAHHPGCQKAWMAPAGQETQVDGPALRVSPLLHHRGRDVALRHAVRLWHFSPHALLGFLQSFGLAPAMCWTGIWFLRRHVSPALGQKRTSILNQVGLYICTSLSSRA